MFADIGGAVSGVVEGISADLAAKSALAAGSSAAAGEFQVDLAALYKHHNDVCDLYDQLGEKITSLQGSELGNVCYVGSRIPGVQNAVDTTMSKAVSGPQSMIGGVMAVRNMVGDYANAIADVYRAYLNADSAGAATLTSAGNPNAADIPVSAAYNSPA